jgi:hypothetical protein
MGTCVEPAYSNVSSIVTSEPASAPSTSPNVRPTCFETLPRFANPLTRCGFVLVRERVLDRQDGRQHLVLDLDHGQSIGGGALVGRGEAGDRVADVRDLVEAERVLIARPRDDAVGHRHVPARAARDDARECQRLREVDREDPRVRVRRAQDARVQHAREREVVGEHRRARDLAPAFDLAVALADDREGGPGFRGSGRAHSAPAFRRSACSRSPAFKQASKILV